MGFIFFPGIRDGPITPEFRTWRNYSSEESEAELTIEMERPVFFLFPFLERGSGAGGRVYST